MHDSHLSFLQMQLKRADHSALGGQQLVLLVNNKIRHSFLTDESGRVSVELDTSNWTETVELIVSNLAHPSGLLMCLSPFL